LKGVTDAVVVSQNIVIQRRHVVCAAATGPHDNADTSQDSETTNRPTPLQLHQNAQVL